jgi:hypothetical protein
MSVTMPAEPACPAFANLSPLAPARGMVVIAASLSKMSSLIPI